MSVYFAQVGDFMKIGYAKDPVARVDYLTYMENRPAEIENGDRVDLIGWYPGDLADEAAAHELFADQRVIGEWFTATPEMTAHLESHPEVALMDGMTLGALRLIRSGVPAAEARATYPARPEAELLADFFGGMIA